MAYNRTRTGQEDSTMKVTNMTSPRRGKEVVNQFIIETDEGRYFQSYKTVIVFRSTTGQLWMDKDTWNYSVTTAKYRNQFTGLTTKQTEDRIKDGRITLIDLN
jgi:hypothetical protein